MATPKLVLTNTSKHGVIIGPKPRSKRAPGEARAPMVLYPHDAKASDGSNPSRAEVEGDTVKVLKDNLALKSAAAHIGLRIQ